MARRPYLSLFALVVLTAWGCVEAPAEAQRSAPRTHIVRIEGMVFRPSSLTVSAGDKVVWVNKDLVPHAAAAPGAGLDSKTLEFNKSFTQAFPTPGEFEYVCPFHPTMKATLRVR